MQPVLLNCWGVAAGFLPAAQNRHSAFGIRHCGALPNIFLQASSELQNSGGNSCRDFGISLCILLHSPFLSSDIAADFHDFAYVFHDIEIHFGWIVESICVRQAPPATLGPEVGAEKLQTENQNDF